MFTEQLSWVSTSYHHGTNRRMFGVWFTPWSPLPFVRSYLVICTFKLGRTLPQLLSVWILWMNGMGFHAGNASVFQEFFPQPCSFPQVTYHWPRGQPKGGAFLTDGWPEAIKQPWDKQWLCTYYVSRIHVGLEHSVEDRTDQVPHTLRCLHAYAVDRK